jgi:uncharacterized protein (TIGR02265 family)
MARSDWVPPVLDRVIDVERWIASCPSSATTQGTFFQSMRETVEEAAGEQAGVELMAVLGGRRFVSFARYPLRDFMRLVVAASAVLHPDRPLAEGLRRLGGLSYARFASTMAGRVVLFALGEDLEGVVNAVPKAYAVTMPGSQVSARWLGVRHVVFEFRGVYSFVDTYHRGVLEGAILEFGFTPRVEPTTYPALCDADFDVTW